MQYLIVDGYNVIYGIPSLRSDLQFGHPAAMERLLYYLSPLIRPAERRIIVACDGGSEDAFPLIMRPAMGLSICYSHSPQSADWLIERLVRRLGKVQHARNFAITVVTDDRPLAAFSQSFGAEILSVKHLENWIRCLTQIQLEQTQRQRRQGDRLWQPRLGDLLKSE